MTDNRIWRTKLAARIHDPAEKALVLFRDPSGHEGGGIVGIGKALGFATTIEERRDGSRVEKLQLPSDVEELIRRADRWAAAADRPQFPGNWARVDWVRNPVLIHPLTGQQYHLNDHGGIERDIATARDTGFRHFSELVRYLRQNAGEQLDLCQVLLIFWRFGPTLTVTAADDDGQQLGALWELLPADTRVPDHSIWDHLDLTSAFAGAFAADPREDAALFAFSIGPVQSFIAAARKMDDLWAGSHLLSRLTWEAMRPLCEELGPDAVLFPRLRGIPQVDLWLRDQMKLPQSLFNHCEWLRGSTDANPLFAAAVPNRFVAVVPAQQAQELAQKCTQSVREWLLEQGYKVVDRLLETAELKRAGAPRDETVYAYRQVRDQLDGFPEVYWAAVPFSLVTRDAERDFLDVSTLNRAMAPLFGVGQENACGFLSTPAWRVLSREITLQGETFFAPNPGVLYPAVYDLTERVLSAAKAARPFRQQAQRGWRDSVTGEAEWLTTDAEQLTRSYRRRTDTLWARIAERKPSWVKKGEHLNALSAIKRLWPTLFAEEVSNATGQQVRRFVVSTHTMALAHQLDQWLQNGGRIADGFDEVAKGVESVALPRRLIRRHAQHPMLERAKLLPGILDAARDSDDESLLRRAQRVVTKTLAAALGNNADGDVTLETYYAFVMMDGDRMGAVLSGDESVDTVISYRESFHPILQQQCNGLCGNGGDASLTAYLEQKRAVSPNRHLAISGALNDFSQIVVPYIVEEEHAGRVIYAGGDDVLAMLPVSDVLSCMQRLRYAYSGSFPEEDRTLTWDQLRTSGRLHCKNGFAYLNGKLMRMMGEKATASCGVVIAHHQAPLSAVLRELRVTEQRAKHEGGRDAFAIAVIKRSGGALYLIDKWGDTLAVLKDLCAFLAHEKTSRRAVYHCLEWIKGIPDLQESTREMLRSLLAYQFTRQSRDDARELVRNLPDRLSEIACRRGNGKQWLTNILAVADFMSREIRFPAG